MSNTLKVRDDHAPVCFEASAEDVDKFKLCEGAEASWLTQSQTFGIKELRSRVEPWLTALFQSEHLSLLLHTLCDLFWRKLDIGLMRDGSRKSYEGTDSGTLVFLVGRVTRSFFKESLVCVRKCVDVSVKVCSTLRRTTCNLTVRLVGEGGNCSDHPWKVARVYGTLVPKRVHAGFTLFSTHRILHFAPDVPAIVDCH